MNPVINEILTWLAALRAEGNSAFLNNQQICDLVSKHKDQAMFDYMLKYNFTSIEEVPDHDRMNAIAASKHAQITALMFGTPGRLALDIAGQVADGGVPWITKKSFHVTRGTGCCELIAQFYPDEILARKEKILEFQREKEAERLREEEYEAERYRERREREAREAERKAAQKEQQKKETERYNARLSSEYQSQVARYNRLSRLESAADDIFYVQKAPWVVLCKVREKADETPFQRRTAEMKTAYHKSHYPTEPVYRSMPVEVESRASSSPKPYIYQVKLEPLPLRLDRFERNQFLVDYSLRSSRHPKPYVAPRVRPIAYHETKLEQFSDYYRIYRNDLMQRLERALRELREFILWKIHDISVEIAGKKVNLHKGMFTDKDIMDMFDALKENLLLRQEKEEAEIKLKEETLTAKITARNEKRLAGREAEAQKVREAEAHEANLLAFFDKQKSCAKTYKTVIRPHNEGVAVETFIALYQSEPRSHAGEMRKWIDLQRRLSFAEIEKYACKDSYFEPKTLRILRQHKELFDQIRWSPVLVRVDLTSINEPRVVPLPTFADREEARQYATWFQGFNLRLFDEKSCIRTFTTRFRTEYSACYFANPLDKIKRLIVKREVYSIQQLMSHIEKHPDALYRNVCGSYVKNEISDLKQHQKDRDDVKIGTTIPYAKAQPPKSLYFKDEELKQIGVETLYEFLEKELTYIPQRGDVVPVLAPENNPEAVLPEEEDSMFGTFLGDLYADKRAARQVEAARPRRRLGV